MISSPIQKTNSLLTTLDEQRIIGCIEGSREGPAIIVLAGMHGNEHAGVEALQNVFNMLEAADFPFSGQFIGVQANMRALKQNQRYLDEDMNRIWVPSIIEKIRTTDQTELESSERREIKQLLGLLDRIIEARGGEPVILADLHSFSADGCMFTITAHKKKHVELLSGLHVPLVFGIEKSLRGTALRYYQDKGHLTFALEGGRHEDELTVYHITASLFLLLQQAGCISPKSFRQLKEFGKHLKQYTANVPDKVELVYQHIIEDGDHFIMRPGYTNFQAVKKGEWLADDREGRIEAQCDGYILMPLYQDQGNDGFFIVSDQI